jgi:hypothetical protein
MPSKLKRILMSGLEVLEVKYLQKQEDSWAKIKKNS